MNVGWLILLVYVAGVAVTVNPFAKVVRLHGIRETTT